MKNHAVDRHGRAPPLRAPRRQTAPARSICESSQPPKMSPFGFASPGIAITRTSGMVCGNSGGDAGVPWRAASDFIVSFTPSCTLRDNIAGHVAARNCISI
jgi:hypothetical protein